MFKTKKREAAEVRPDDDPGGRIIEVDGGEVYIAGEPMSRMSDRNRMRFRAQKMGFIFQSYNLIPVLSGIENVELPLLVAGVKEKRARARVADALEMVGLADQARKLPAEMSGGQQQRVTTRLSPSWRPTSFRRARSRKTP